MLGLINLNKPTGITSRAAINRIQRMVRPHKVGHAGTLDPLACGVLVVTVGRATRLTEHVQRWSKTYRATFLLGRSSETEDIDSEVILEPNAVIPKHAELTAALPALTGCIQQIPPAYSALKVKGRRAYELARAGKRVQLKPRTIQVDSIQIIRYAYPEVELQIQCGSGTYVRSIGRDLARAIGTQAVMSRLTRTAVGHLRVDQSIEWSELDEDRLQQHLLPATEAIRDLPVRRLSPNQVVDVAHGKAVELDGLGGDPEVAAVTPEGHLAAILTRLAGRRYRPSRNFIAAN